MVGSSGIRPRRDHDQCRSLRRLFENLQEDSRVGPAHCIRTIENENAAAALRAEVRSLLNGAQLTYSNHRPGHRSQAAHRIRDDGPDIRIRLQN